jgi:hypothetical protein
MMSPRWVVFATLMLVGSASLPRDAAAQPAPSRKPAPASMRMPGGRVEISGGVGWMGATDLGSVAAQLAGNGVPSGTPVTLFEADSRIESGPRLDGRLAWRWTRMLAFEGAVAVTRTHVRTETRNDFEQAAPSTSTEQFTEYAIEGGVVVQLAKLAFAGGRVRPFITGGGGYLRQVHEDATVIEIGRVGFAGGGVTYALRQRSRGLKTLGVRGDVRVNVRSGGLEIASDSGATGGAHISPSASAGLFIRF